MLAQCSPRMIVVVDWVVRCMVLESRALGRQRKADLNSRLGVGRRQDSRRDMAHDMATETVSGRCCIAQIRCSFIYLHSLSA